MKPVAKLGVLLVALVLPVVQPRAQDTLMAEQGPLSAEVLRGCGQELTEYCATVTLGEGRLLACLYAYSDKISGQCELSLFDAAARLERAINMIAYVAEQCRLEIATHCSDIQPGGGRVTQCLRKHVSDLSPQCDQALTNLGA